MKPPSPPLWSVPSFALLGSRVSRLGSGDESCRWYRWMGEEDEERIRNGTGAGAHMWRHCGFRFKADDGSALLFHFAPFVIWIISSGEICECRWGFAQRGHFAIFGNWRFRVDNSILQMKARSSSVIDLYKLIFDTNICNFFLYFQTFIVNWIVSNFWRTRT